MTDQQTLDDIAMLLMRYAGISYARGFTSENDGQVRIYFRCRDFDSLKSIAFCAVAANVSIVVGDPRGRMCYEAEGVVDLSFDLTIDEQHSALEGCTETQVFGIYLARNLKHQGLLDSETADQLQRRWNAYPW